MGSEQRNALIAVVLSGLILFGWQQYFSPTKVETAPVGPTMPEQASQPAKPSDFQQPVAPIEPIAEDFIIRGSGVSITFDNTLTVKNIENLQAAFRFEDTIESKQPMRVEFDFGKGFQTLVFSKTKELNKYYNPENDISVETSLTDDGVINFNVFSSKSFNPFSDL